MIFSIVVSTVGTMKPIAVIVSICVAATGASMGILVFTLGATLAGSHGPPSRSAASHGPLQTVTQVALVTDDHHCADLLVQTEVQLAVVRGVWDCLEPPVQALFKGTGDEALVGRSPYFTGVKFIGCDGSMCVYALAFEATTAGTTGLSETTMSVWIDGRGLVAHAAIPKAIP